MADNNLPNLEDEHPEIVGLAAGIGFSIVFTLVACIAAGIGLDKWQDTSPLFTLLGVGIGLIGAGYQLYELIRVSDRKRPNGPLARSMSRRIGNKRTPRP